MFWTSCAYHDMQQQLLLLKWSVNARTRNLWKRSEMSSRRKSYLLTAFAALGRFTGRTAVTSSTPIALKRSVARDTLNLLLVTTQHLVITVTWRFSVLVRVCTPCVTKEIERKIMLRKKMKIYMYIACSIIMLAALNSRMRRQMKQYD